jgi:hypothetical protein
VSYAEDFGHCDQPDFGDWGLEEYQSPLSELRCRYCSSTNVRWKETITYTLNPYFNPREYGDEMECMAEIAHRKWRLHNEDGTLHDCRGIYGKPKRTKRVRLNIR